MADQIAGAHFGKRLKYYRRRRKLTQKAIAELFGIGSTTVVAWERQPHPIKDPFQLSELARYLAISVDELVGIESVDGDTRSELEKRADEIAREWLSLSVEGRARVEGFLASEKGRTG